MNSYWDTIINDQEAAADAFCSLVGLPTTDDFPRLGTTTSWSFEDWIEWGSPYGYAAGIKTPRSQQFIHAQWPQLMTARSLNNGNQREAMNFARDVRKALNSLVMSAVRACRSLNRAGNLPPDGYNEAQAWVINEFSGDSGRELITKAAESVDHVVVDPEIKKKATQLFAEMKSAYPTPRLLLAEAGLETNQIERLMLLNKGTRTEYVFGPLSEDVFVGLSRLKKAAQEKEAEVVQVRKSDARRAAKAEDAIEVLSPETIAASPAPIPSNADSAINRKRDELVSATKDVADRNLSIAKRSAEVTRETVQGIDTALTAFVKQAKRREAYIYKGLVEALDAQKALHTELVEMEESIVYDLLARLPKIASDSHEVLRSSASDSAYIIDVTVRQGVELEALKLKLMGAERRVKELEVELASVERQSVADPDLLVPELERVLTLLSTTDFTQVPAAVAESRKTIAAVLELFVTAS